MNGKELPVREYNLTYGSALRVVSVFGVFKYIPNSNIYVVYGDSPIGSNVIRFGTSHVRGNCILSMQSSNSRDMEVVKEYIYKVVVGDDCKDFEIIKLDNVDFIELIGSNILELKKDVLVKLYDLTIPKKEVKIEEKVVKEKKKSNPLVVLLILFIMIVVGCFCYFCFFRGSSEVVDKKIICKIMFKHDEIDDVMVEEEYTLNFGSYDRLDSIDKVSLYRFLNEDSYLNFIGKGLYYKYLPDNSDVGSWSKDDDKYYFKFIVSEKVDSLYDKPVEYEEILSYYKGQGYECEENIID